MRHLIVWNYKNMRCSFEIYLNQSNTKNHSGFMVTEIFSLFWCQKIKIITTILCISMLVFLEYAYSHLNICFWPHHYFYAQFTTQNHTTLNVKLIWLFSVGMYFYFWKDRCSWVFRTFYKTVHHLSSTQEKWTIKDFTWYKMGKKEKKELVRKCLSRDIQWS